MIEQLKAYIKQQLQVDAHITASLDGANAAYAGLLNFIDQVERDAAQEQRGVDLDAPNVAQPASAEEVCLSAEDRVHDTDAD